MVNQSVTVTGLAHIAAVIGHKVWKTNRYKMSKLNRKKKKINR